MEHNKYIMLKRLLHGVCQIYTLRIHVATNADSLPNICNTVFISKIAKSKKKKKLVFIS